MCGIALVRERCKADVEALLGDRGDDDLKDIPHIGAHPASGLRAFVATGDRDRLDNALGYLNARQSTPAMWIADARGAALYDAGIETVLLPAAQGVEVVELLGSQPVTDLIDHAAQVPSGLFPVAVPSPKRDGPGVAPGAARLPKGAVNLPEGTMRFAHDPIPSVSSTAGRHVSPPSPHSIRRRSPRSGQRHAPKRAFRTAWRSRATMAS